MESSPQDVLVQYYRARYYDPTTGRFLSEDPLGFKGTGPNFYVYAAGSPTNFIDPLGLTIGVIGDSQSVTQAINYLSRDPGMNQMIAEMQLSDTVYTIITTSSNDADFTDVAGDEHTIIWNPHLGLKCAHRNGQEYGAVITPALALGHELAHQRHDWEAFFLGFVRSKSYTDLEEWRVIHYYENPAARTLGEGIRSDHFGETEWVATPVTEPQCNCQGQRGGR